MERWAGRVALVTGAASGIGASTAEKLVKHGMKVIGCDKNTKKIQEMVVGLKDEKGSLHAISCDLREEGQILSMFEEIKGLHGGVDVCVNCAGLGKIASLIDGETEKWREVLEVNVLGLCICTREAIQSMITRNVNDGHIIHMCSIRGHDIPPGHESPMYCASKFAVRALTEGLRNELCQIKSGIRISSISPGAVKTGYAISMRGETAGNDLYRKIHHLTAHDVSESIIYALSAPTHVQIHEVLIHPIKKPEDRE